MTAERPHRPPRPPRTQEQSPETRRDLAIASAAQAFALLCDAATEAVEFLTEEFKLEMEDKRK